MRGNHDNGETPIIHAKIETIINYLQECPKTHGNRLTGDGVKMVEFAYMSFGYMKDGIPKKMPWGVLGIFMDVWFLCAFFNMDYTSKSYFLERLNMVRGIGFKFSGESCVASTSDQ